MIGRNTVLTNDEIEQIRVVYEETRNQCKVAKITHHSCRTVSKYIKELGLNGGIGCNQPQKKIPDEELITEAKYMTRREIATKHGLHITNVDRNLKRLGIKCIHEREKHGEI